MFCMKNTTYHNVIRNILVYVFRIIINNDAQQIILGTVMPLLDSLFGLTDLIKDKHKFA